LTGAHGSSDGTDTPKQHAALSAKEKPDNTYTGVWTTENPLAEKIREIVDGLDARPVTAES